MKSEKCWVSDQNTDIFARKVQLVLSLVNDEFYSQFYFEGEKHSIRVWDQISSDIEIEQLILTWEVEYGDGAIKQVWVGFTK